MGKREGEINTFIDFEIRNYNILQSPWYHILYQSYYKILTLSLPKRLHYNLPLNTSTQREQKRSLLHTSTQQYYIQ